MRSVKYVKDSELLYLFDFDGQSLTRFAYIDLCFPLANLISRTNSSLIAMWYWPR
jgi:hypothetical protein